MDDIEKRLLIHEHVIRIPGMRRHVLCQFGDTHITAWDGLSTPEEKKRAEKGSANWIETRKMFADLHGEPCGPYQMRDHMEILDDLFTVAGKADMVAMVGDMMDAVTPADLRAMEKRLEMLEVPYVIACGNHEKKGTVPEGLRFSIVNRKVQTAEDDELRMICLDNADRSVSGDQLSVLRDSFKDHKKTVVVFHVPFVTEGNREEMEKAGEYFWFNYPGCPEENLELLKIIRENRNDIAMVLAGHLHFMNDSKIVDGVMQYVSSQGITGYMNRFVIGEG